MPNEGRKYGVGLEFDPSRMAVASIVPGLSAALQGTVAVGDHLVGVDGNAQPPCTKSQSHMSTQRER